MERTEVQIIRLSVNARRNAWRKLPFGRIVVGGLSGANAEPQVAGGKAYVEIALGRLEGQGDSQWIFFSSKFLIASEPGYFKTASNRNKEKLFGYDQDGVLTEDFQYWDFRYELEEAVGLPIYLYTDLDDPIMVEKIISRGETLYEVWVWV